MWNLLIVLLVISGAIIALIGLDRLLLWMESKGWIYWRKVKPKGGGLSAGLTAMHQLVEPDVRHVREDRERRTVIHSADSSAADQPPVGEDFHG
jgi:hypothetical protein